MTPELRATVFDAADRHLRYNAPLSAERAGRLQDWIAARLGGVGRVVDLGCGSGAFLIETADRAGVPGLGVDRLAGSLANASADADARAAAAQEIALVEADIAEWWPDAADLPTVVVLVGAEHAFGGLDGALTALHTDGVVGALLGVAFWGAEPNDWCLEAFGELPANVDELTEAAARRGWRVDVLEVSTTAEWDAFEGGWCTGAETAIAQLDDDAAAEVAEFVAERREQYDEYRGVLGFAWLGLVPA